MLRRHRRDHVREISRREPERRAERARVVRAADACTLDHVFGFAFGWPVLPEVKPIATICSPSICGTSLAAAAACGIEPDLHVVRRDAIARRIAERIAARMAGQHLLDRVQRARRRQQVGLPASHDRTESDQERVAILAEIHRITRRRQRRRDRMHIGKEPRNRQRMAVTPCEYPIRLCDGQQRQRQSRTFDDSRHVPLPLATQQWSHRTSDLPTHS